MFQRYIVSPPLQKDGKMEMSNENSTTKLCMVLKTKSFGKNRYWLLRFIYDLLLM
jgi:ribosomal protein RSM22 (predicted rRNA methylase)